MKSIHIEMNFVQIRQNLQIVTEQNRKSTSAENRKKEKINVKC